MLSLGKKSGLVFVSIFVIIFILSLYFKLIPVLNYNFPFTMDQARDMLDIRRIVELKRPTLIGPTTSINGVFLGPFYYYFNLIPYLASGGDPAALTYWNIAFYMLGGFLLFWFFFKKDKILALITSGIFLMAPANFYSSRYFWSANPMPYITIFYFLAILNFLRKVSFLNAALIGLISGLSMQIEAAFGVLFLPFFLIFSVLRRVHFKYILSALLAFFITLLPQILFELRNNFVMTQVFFSEVSGKSQILGDRLTLPEIFKNHFLSFADFSYGLFEISRIFSEILLVVAFIVVAILFVTKKLTTESRNIFILSTGFILFGFIFYMFYSFPLKGWYLLGLRIPYLLIIALFFHAVFKSKLLPLKILLVGFFVFSAWVTIDVQSKFILKDNDRSGDKSTLRNEIEAIDWVYEKAGGNGFKAYNYIPSVYDFPYQYLYWWHGTKKYGYQPEVLTYLDNVPEYIKDNDRFYTKRKKADDSMAFLIYEVDVENPKRLHAWLGSFTHLCTIEKQEYPWGTTVELRKDCLEATKSGTLNLQL